jgi:indole-3-glycerol phosphate synthase
MSILDQIIAAKEIELAGAKSRVPVRTLEASVFFTRKPVSLAAALWSKEKSGIIAEFKRRSPSKGLLNADATIEDTTVAYVNAGASALSILTDRPFFNGANDDLIKARGLNSCPILRKDFTIDEYQIIEAKSIGADAILLIAAVLRPAQAKQLASCAHSLGMDVLLEVHDELELANMEGVDADLIGVNNRNLKTFEVSLMTSMRLAPMIGKDVVKVSESGISDPQSIRELQALGFEGFLIGETFMKSRNPGQAAKEFMDKLRNTK